MSSAYAEIHCKSFYSFGQGASHIHELLARAVEFGYPALALTDTNLCGALEFARLANSLGIEPVTGCELTLISALRLFSRRLSTGVVEWRQILLVWLAAAVLLVSRAFWRRLACADGARR